MGLRVTSGRGLLWAAGLIALAANLLLVLVAVQWIAALAATALALLPGYLWVEGLLCKPSDHERSVLGWAERAAIGVGGGVMECERSSVANRSPGEHNSRLSDCISEPPG